MTQSTYNHLCIGDRLLCLNDGKRGRIQERSEVVLLLCMDDGEQTMIGWANLEDWEPDSIAAQEKRRARLNA
ncbi:MAG: hypothetical protein JO069_11845 [Verrucomicrobia bacterium]|nr:hypothetical protein [Verrucomicrobiota bacterium]